MMAHQNALAHRPLASLLKTKKTAFHKLFILIYMFLSQYICRVSCFLLPDLAVSAQNNVKQVGYFGHYSTLTLILQEIFKEETL